VAETAISRLLACVEPEWTTRSAENRPGVATAHQADVAGQSNVGLTADRLGAKNAGHRCRKIYGRAVQTQAPQTALPQLANFSRAACPRTGLDRLLRRANRQIEGPVCIGRLSSRSALDCPFQCHRTSNGSMDGAGHRLPSCSRAPSLLPTEGCMNIRDPQSRILSPRLIFPFPDQFLEGNDFFAAVLKLKTPRGLRNLIPVSI